MSKYLILFSLLALALIGCADASNVESTPLPTSAAVAGDGDILVPTLEPTTVPEFSAIDEEPDPSELPSGGYQIEIIGSEEFVFEGETSFNTPYNVRFTNADNDDIVVDIRLALAPQLETYAITRDIAFEADERPRLGEYGSALTTGENRVYVVTAGSITFTDVEETMVSGYFEFNAALATGERVIVRGVFNELTRDAPPPTPTPTPFGSDIDGLLGDSTPEFDAITPTPSDD